MIYLDHAATTPMSEKALIMYGEAAKKAFGNSSSLHDIGGFAGQTLEASRKRIASLIGGNEKGLYFTSGGSEANILAVQSLLNGLNASKNHIITSQIEHSSLFHFFQKLKNEGYDVTFLKPNKTGHIEPNVLEKAIREQTGLVSIQHGNSEIGVVQPLEEFGKLLQKKQILFHSDCVQTFGKIPIHIEKLNLDAISISSHKIYGPKGVGAAYIRPSAYWQPVITGTTHESGFRPGTVDVPSIVAFATAATDIFKKMDEHIKHYVKLRELLLDLLQSYKSISVINEQYSSLLPNILPIHVKGIEGQYVMLECNRYGYAISTGSACQVGMQAPSRTLLALGFDEQKAKQYIRLSLGIETTEEEIRSFTEVLITILKDFDRAVCH